MLLTRSVVMMLNRDLVLDFAISDLTLPFFVYYIIFLMTTTVGSVFMKFSAQKLTIFAARFTLEANST